MLEWKLPHSIERVSTMPALILTSVAVWLACTAWMRPLSVPDEVRYTDVARWMAQHGDWLVPRIDGLPFLHKPPLYFWLEAAAIRVSGEHLLVDRWVSIAAGVLICGCVYWLVRSFADGRQALWSVAVLAVCPLFFGGSQFANMDMLVAAFIALTLTLAVLAARSATPAPAYWIGAYAAAGFALLSKGLIGIVLPAAIYVSWAVWSGRRDWIVKAVSVPGLIVLALVAIPWFLMVEAEIPGFLRYFIVYHHFQRFAESGFNNPVGPWFYPALLLFAALPFLLPLYEQRRHRVEDPAGKSLQRLGIVWFVIVLVFFSIPKSKLTGYIFPILPAFAILVGPRVAASKWRPLATAGGACLCIALLIAAIALHKPGATAVIEAVRAEIAAEDDVAFLDRYYFEAALSLNRKRPILIVGDWSKKSSELHDGVHRQLTEGGEFDPRARAVLIDRQALHALQRRDVTLWLVTSSDRSSNAALLGEGFVRVANRHGYAVLRSTWQGP